MLEVDIVVLNSLKELFEIDMENHAFVAIKDQWHEEFQELFDIPKKYRHCNTGMFMANLRLWKEMKIEEHFFTNINQYGKKLIFPGQDIFKTTF